MTDIPIVLCFDDRILIGAGVTIKSLLNAAQPETIYEVNVLSPGFTDDIRRGLQQLTDGTRHSIRFFDVPPERFDGVPKGRGSWTEIVYYRLLSSEIIADRERVIYSDVDVFFKDDLTEAFNVDLTDIEWAGVPVETNTPEKIMHYYFPENTKPRIVTSCFMVMNLALMRERNVVQRYFDTIDKIGDRLVFFDLDLVNIATPEIAEVGLRYSVFEEIFEADDVTQAADYAYLKTIYSVEDVEAARDNPAVIHFAGKRGKPWQRQHTNAYYRNVEKSLPSVLRAFNFRNFRKKWLSRKGYRRPNSRSA